MAKTARKSKQGTTARAGKAAKKRRPAARAARKARQVRKAAPARKAAARRAVKKATVKKAPAKRKAAPKAAARKAARKVAVKKPAARKVAASKAPVRKAVVSPAARKPAPSKAVATKVLAVKAKASAPKVAAAAAKASMRKAPALDRQRRTVGDAAPVPTPPSSLTPGHASAARSGADELRVKLAAHTGTGPAITAGDVDADWAAAEAIGDEAPGGDNPTPDQDVVDEIGRALGVEYDDDEELQGGDEIASRDRDRWELDPASSDDFDER